MHWTVLCFIHLLPALMLSNVSETLSKFIQVSVWYFASCMATFCEQDVENKDIIELMDEKSRTVHLHSFYYGSFTLIESAINAAFSLALKFCSFVKL